MFFQSRKTNKIRLSICFLLIAFLPSFCQAGSANKKEDEKVAHKSLENRGEQLRAAINKAHQSLVEGQTRRPMGSNDITDVVVKYIPIGTSFNDAEIILRHAGFKVAPRPGPNPPGNRPDKYDVIASIVPFVDKFPTRTNVYVFLSPVSPGDYGEIKKVYAGITVSFP